MVNCDPYHVLRGALLAILLASISAQNASAAPTKLLSYQGRITDANGQPITNGLYTIRFKLYAVSADCTSDLATQVWTETDDGGVGNPAQVTVTNGLFSVVLGTDADVPLNMSFDTDYWLQVKVGANPVFSPCDRLTTAPYSIRSIDANTAVNAKACSADSVCEVGPQDGVSEGGEIQLAGAGANVAWQIDNYAGRVRMHSGGTSYFDIDAGNTLNITGDVRATKGLRTGGTGDVTDGSIAATGWIGAGCEANCETAGGYAIMYAGGTSVQTSTADATQFRDFDNTAYYVDPASTTVLNEVGWGSSQTRTQTRDDAGAMGGKSGFYESAAPAPAADWPAGAASWWHLLDVRHSNTANNYAMQFSGSFFDQNLYFRKTNNVASTAWKTVAMTDSTVANANACSGDTTCETNNLSATGTITNTGTLTTPGYISITGVSDSAGNLRFSAANPYIYATSYFVAPGGAYFNSGTVYVQNALMARNYIQNDDTPNGGRVRIADTTDVTGAAGGLRLGAEGWDDGGTTYGHVVSDAVGYKALMIVGNDIAGNSGWGREVKVWDYLNVQGSVNITSFLRRSACPTGWVNRGNTLCVEDLDYCYYSFSGAANFCRARGIMGSHLCTNGEVRAAMTLTTTIGNTWNNDYLSDSSDDNQCAYVNTATGQNDIDGEDGNCNDADRCARCCINLE